MAGGKATLYLMGLDLSYRPLSGFAAASMDVRAFRLACATAAKFDQDKPSRVQTLRTITCAEKLMGSVSEINPCKAKKNFESFGH